jgi:glycosyltransferase involved in cell wall biosynthesis
MSHYQPGMLRGANIVVTGQQAWDVEIGSNCKNIALEFSKHNKVLYVNAPLDRITLWRNRKDPGIRKRLAIIKGKQSGLEQINENLWVYYPDRMIESINWLPDQRLFEWMNYINNRKFAGSIRRALSTLGIDRFFLFNDNDIFRSFHLKALLLPEAYIYYSRDFLLAVDYWKKHGAKLEPELIAGSDLCVANSSYLAGYCRRYNQHAYDVGQGCDLDIFTEGLNSSTPDDIADIPYPIIGYVGALQSLRLDIDLLCYIATSRPEWQLVFVGPEDDSFRQSELHRLPNVHFTGSKDFSKLPAYIHAFDVCINPQLLNEVTIGNYPRKIDEYLALGKPVVATHTETMNLFRDHTYLGETPEDYLRLIEQALSEDSPEKQAARRQFAATHTWENSVRAIYAAIRKVTDTSIS